MKIITIENPPLSFSPQKMTIEKQNDITFKILVDGKYAGLAIWNNEILTYNLEDIPFTNDDISILNLYCMKLVSK